ncbi:MAG TPA: hypothetical protein VFZ32_19380 [Micromonosporaceae bacterium]
MRFANVAGIFMIVAGIVAGASGPALAQPGTSETQQRELRVMCFNIHHGVGLDGRLDLERIARVTESQAAEVVGLQEVDRHFSTRSTFVDQARWLADRLGMHVVFGANLSYRNVGQCSGLQVGGDGLCWEGRQGPRAVS